MSEDDGIEGENGLSEADMTALTGANTKAPIGKVTGFPLGNPDHIGPDERELRKSETEKFGRETAATRAWARATEKRAKAGTSKGSNSEKSAKPSKATDFREAPMAGAVKAAAKGKSKAELEKWAKSVQFAHALLAMKMENEDFALSEDEALLLTEAVIDVLEYYNIKLKGQASAWGGLAYAVGMIYGPRIASLVISRIKNNQVKAS
jgi:hypothetical protein